MRNACLFIAFTLNLALAQPTAPVSPAAAPATAQVDSGKSVVDTAETAPAVTAPVPAASAPAPTQAETVESPAPEANPAPTDITTAPPGLLPPPGPSKRPFFNDYGLVAREYTLGVAGQVVAGALGFFIGSAIETAFAGEEKAHKGTLTFTGIRYDNFYGAFWGGTVGGFMGSTLTTYFTGQSDEEDGGFFWTLVGTGLAGAGGLYAAHLMGVNDAVDWTPFVPLLAIPTAGGVLGFNFSRWFSDKKRESIMGPDAGLHLNAPTVGWAMTPTGERFQLQALNLSF